MQYPVLWTDQSALHFTLWQTCSFRHQLAWEAFNHAVYWEKTIHFISLFIVRYSFRQNWGVLERTKMCKLRKVVKGMRTQALSIASPAFYHWAPQICVWCVFQKRPLGPFYLVPMPGEVKYSIEVVNVQTIVDSRYLNKDKLRKKPVSFDDMSRSLRHMSNKTQTCAFRQW